jgi:hypothetical protein
VVYRLLNKSTSLLFYSVLTILLKGILS